MHKYFIALLFIIQLHLDISYADEIINRYLYKVGDEIKYKVQTILPSKSEFVTISKLISINEEKEIWEIQNSPSADKRIFHRSTGNWIASFKDGNEVARAIPYNGGLKFPLYSGDKWESSWTFTAAGGLITGKSEAKFKVKKESIKQNGKRYKTLKISMKNPKWNSSKDTNWKNDIKWIDIKTGKTIKLYFKNMGFKMEYTAILLE